MSYSHNRLKELCERLIEERITPLERSELEAMVLRFPEAKTYYCKFVRRHVALFKFFETYRTHAPELTPGRTTDFRRNDSTYRKAFYYAVPILLILLFLGGFLVRKAIVSDKARVSAPTEVATTEDRPVDSQPVPEPAKAPGDAEWGSIYWGWGHDSQGNEDSNALRKNDRIGPGRLEVQTGMATIRFDHGVALIVESPTSLEIKEPQRCFLHYGRVYAKVSPEATGFTIDTSVAEIKDLGTEFGVNIREGENADVHVYSGRVDVTPKGKDDFVPVTTGGWLQFRPGDIEPFRPQDRYADSKEGIACSTAFGRGREACVIMGGTIEQLNPALNSDSRIFTLIKNGLTSDWNRKAYFSIDLSMLSGDRYENVRLELTFAPTGVGASSYVPESSTFTVYGLLDESKDDWDETTLTWENAPANASGGAEVDPQKTVRIASFELARKEEPIGIVIENETLQQFLSSDTNKLVTFIVVRDTEETTASGQAHGFANRRHPILPPPTLRFFR